MRKYSKVVAIILCVVLALTVFASCGENSNSNTTQDPTIKEDPVVRVAVHANMGAALCSVAMEQGYFEEENVKLKVTIVNGGVPEMTAMRADNATLDLGYIGAGVSWNAWDPAGNQLDLLYLDNLGDSEMFIANKRFGIDLDSTNLEVANAIKGNKIYLEVGTTPGNWLLTYVDLLNKEFDNDSDKIWLSCNDPSYLQGYVAPNDKVENKLEVINMTNANITSAMAVSSGNKVELSVVYSPVSTAIMKSNDEVATVATTGTKFSPDKLSPGVWVGNSEFIANNEELVQRFVNALVKASEYASKNYDGAARAAEKFCQLSEGSIDPNSVVLPSKATLSEWFESYDGLGYAYMQSLYNSRVGNVPAESGAPKTLGEAFNSKFMMKALREQA